MIKYLQREQIDDQRWNAIIAASSHETIYPYTWYLDACADNWAALLMNDYEYIMPIAFRSKLGLKYIYQPVYCQQLGVLSELSVENEIVSLFLQTLKKHYKLGDYAFNEGNIFGEEQGFEVSENHNYVLKLNSNYDAIFNCYSENCRRNLKRSQQENIEFTDKISLSEVLQLKSLGSASYWTDFHQEYAKKLYLQLHNLGVIRIFAIKNQGEVLAAAIFAFSKDRAIFLLSASSEEGKKQRAMFYLIDSFIQMYTGEVKMLDFEGSNIPSIARFFQGFGAKPQIYQRISFQNTTNRLIKKIRGV
jgi:hypothetical protein